MRSLKCEVERNYEEIWRNFYAEPKFTKGELLK
jgi:hypothetical protein